MGRTVIEQTPCVARPVRSAAQVSVAALAALVVVPVCTAKGASATSAPTVMARAAKCILTVELINLDLVSDGFVDASPICVMAANQRVVPSAVVEPIIQTFVTIMRIGGRHGP